VAWCPEEDELYKQKMNDIERKISQIWQFFPNRTDVALKNRWIMIERSERKQKPIQYKKKKSLDQISTTIKANSESESEKKEKVCWEKFILDCDWLSPQSNLFW
jgi:hypothetical protein